MKLSEAWKPYWQRRGGKGNWPWIPFALQCIPAGSTVLDVGCGDGLLLERAKAKGCRVFGVDVLPEAIAFCEKKGIPGKAGDFRYMRFGGRRFDVVVMSEVLAFVPEPEIFLKRAAALLGKNGRIVVTAGNAGSLVSRYLIARGKIVDEPEPPLYYRRLTKAKLERMVAAAGLRVSMWNSFTWLGPLKYFEVSFLQGPLARYLVAVLERTP